ncbi:MAG: PQQ-binding-like beta-propeller repeat protein, partial [Armatimonadota bacterium]
TYYFSVRAQNGAGIWSDPGTSDGIIADRTPPSTPAVSDDGAYSVSNSQLHASWSASDTQSGIAGFEYAIGTTAGTTDVRSWTALQANQVTVTGLSLQDGQIYYFAVRARNGAGQWSAVGFSDGITIDSTPPSTPVVTDDGAYTTMGDSLHATWFSSEPHTAITDYQYAIGTTAGGSNIVNWTSAGLATSITRTGLSLSDGGSYYISVKATKRSGLTSTVGISDGIIVDRTPPTMPVVTDDGAFTSSLDSLHAAWTASDAQSGIADYQYAIGTTAGGTNVVNYTSVGTATQVTRTGLNLADGGKYYFSVRAKNGSGLTSGTGVSDGITVDASGPGKPVVVDDGQYTTSVSSLHASWSADPGISGIVDFLYAIGATAGGTDVVNWTSVGTSLEVTRAGLTLISGRRYYFAVKARNAVGVTSPIGISDGITVDHSSPTQPLVIDDGQYTSSLDTLHASWSSTDAQSGIAEYQYAIGTSSGASNVVNWTSVGTATQISKSGLTLTDGAVYYFAVRAINGAGLTGAVGVSDGITIDRTLPSTPIVTDEGAYTSSPDTLSASWTSSDALSGVIEYQYAIGTSTSGVDVVGWTSVGVNTSVVKSGLALQDGTMYYFQVKAKSGAGQFSQIGVSDGIRADKSPPALPVVTDDGDYTAVSNQLHASWVSAEPHSGIAEYQYAIGSSPGGTDVVNWTSTSTTPFVTRSGLSLSEGVSYYISVKARNLLNMWSAVGSSDGIRVDRSPPSTPVVADEGDTTASGDSLSATFTANDPQGGIADYFYAIGTTSGGTDVVPFTSAGVTGQVTRTGLTLNPGITYYFAVKAKNRAGLWSPVGVSDGIMYISSITWPKFRGDTRNTGVSQVSGSRFGALLWEYSVSGWLDSSPSIAGDGSIYYGAGDGALYAFAKTGVLKWKYQTQGPVDSSPAIGKNGNLFFGSYDGNLYSITPSGVLLWQFAVPDAIWSSPVIGPDDAIYFGCQSGGFYAVKADGSQKWKFNTGGAVWSSPALSDDGVLYFGSGDGYIYAVYASNGQQKWRFFTGSAVDSSPAIGIDGTVYAGSGDGYFYALNPNGTLKWKYSVSYPPDCSAAIGPDNTIYVGYGNDWSVGSFIAFRPDGTIKWQFDAHGMVRSSPVLSPDGMLYFGSGDGNIYAIDTNGVLKWKYQSGYAILSSPVVSNDGSVVVASYNGKILTFKDSSIDDPTGPLRPVVTDQGAATTSLTTLSASWTSSDPESGVSDYKYCIGTWPGTDDVVPWTAVGAAVSVTRSDLTLTPGVIYYFSVIARNEARIWSSTGFSDGIAVVTSSAAQSVGQAKQASDGIAVYLTNKIVTAVFNDSFYIQEPNRSAAIKVIPTNSTMPAEGDTISLAGSLINDNGEKSVRMTTMLVQQHGEAAKSIFMLISNLGGSAPSQSIPGVTGGNGVNTIGMLAEISGRVLSVSGGSWLMDDGSPAVDPLGVTGVRISTFELRAGQVIEPPAVGDFVRVIGIVTMESSGSGYRRVLRPRTQADVVTMQ